MKKKVRITINAKIGKAAEIKDKLTKSIKFNYEGAD